MYAQYDPTTEGGISQLEGLINDVFQLTSFKIDDLEPDYYEFQYENIFKDELIARSW